MPFYFLTCCNFLFSDGISVTRMCTGSFYIGAKWGNPNGKCEKPAEGITLQLKNIYDVSFISVSQNCCFSNFLFLIRNYMHLDFLLTNI